MAIISLAAGILGTVSGGGGGSFVVPAIVSTVNEQPSILVGSVFLMYLSVSVTGFIVYGRKKLVDYRAGIILAIPAVPGVIIGTLLENTISDFEFKLGLGLLTACLGGMMLLFRRREPSLTNGTSILVETDPSAGSIPKALNSSQRTLVDVSGRIFSYNPNFAIGVAINFAAGILSGIFGAGAAVIIVPTTILLVRMPSHVAIATTRIILMGLNVSALITHIGIGAINTYYALILAIPAIIGAVAGAKIAFKIPPGTLTKLIATILAILGAYLVVASFV
ncbi:MAG: sulfite exporter TauE/SafE family protein [Nitrososphaerales archaeon]